MSKAYFSVMGPVNRSELNMKYYFRAVILVMLYATIHSTEVIEKEQIETLNHSDYCIFNDSFIIKKVDGTLLDIVNDTGDWLLSTDGTTLFMCPTNGSYCEDDDYKPNIVLYAVQTSIYCINFLFASCTIALHLYFKDLRTVFGVLIIMICFFLDVNQIITFIHNRYQFTHTVDESAVCAMFVYLRGILNFLDHSIKFTILFHFTYLMHNSFMAKSGGPILDKVLMCKYVVFICSLTTIYSVVIIPYDIAVARDAFMTEGGYCAISFVDGTAVIIFIAQLAFLTVVELTTFSVGMLFYFLVSKRCCEFKTSDIRVSFVLVATAGINRVSFLVCYALSDSTGYAFLAGSVVTALEQTILFIIFLTSKKVLSILLSICT